MALVLYGSLGSFVAGFGHFLLTIRIRRSYDAGEGGFILATFKIMVPLQAQ